MFKLFKNCDGGREKLKGILKDFCFINAGRLKYARNDFKGGLNELEKVKIYSGACPTFCEKKLGLIIS